MSKPVMTPQVDRITGAALIIDHAEHDVHDGRSYAFTWTSTAPLPTNIGEETALAFLTPAAAVGIVHLLIDVLANDESVFEIRENPTIVLNQGTSRLVPNRNRGSAQTTGVMDRESGTSGRLSNFTVVGANNADLSGGTILHSETIARGGNPPFGSVINSASRARREWILAPSTEYVIILTSATVNDTTHWISLNWSEDVESDFAN